jgi:hypothetical protein
MTRSLAFATLVLTLVAAAPAAATERRPELLRPPELGTSQGDLGGVSADGSLVVFRSEQPLTSADTDSSDDLYALVGGRLQLVSDRVQPGPDQEEDVDLEEISRDGSHILFSTEEPLTTDDGDAAGEDVYERTAGVTQLVSDRQQAGPDADEDTSGVDLSADGSRIFFQTDEPLVAADGDASGRDVYERSAGTTRLRSDRVNAGADENVGASLRGISEDGRNVVFQTDEPITASDADAGSLDVFVTFDDGAGLSTSHLSDRIAPGGDQNVDASVDDVTPDASAVVFRTSEKLVIADDDASNDEYLRKGGTTTIASDRRRLGFDEETPTQGGLVSDDGTVVAFQTAEALVDGDDDAVNDVYTSRGGVLRLASDRVAAGPDGSQNLQLLAVTADNTAVFVAEEPLVDADTDTALDTYSSTGGAPTLLSDRRKAGGDSAAAASVVDIAGDHVFFSTTEDLVDGDDDPAQDIYDAFGGGLTLVSDRVAPGTDADLPAKLGDTSADGETVFLGTAEALTADDTNTAADVYAARPVPPAPPVAGPPAGGGAQQAPPPPLVDGVAPALSGLSFKPGRLALGKSAAIKFRSSEAARATLVFERVTCKKKSKRARRCTKTFKRTGSALRVNAKAGTNSVKFKPGRGFKAGDYRLRLNATDSAGNKAKEKRANFKLVAQKKRR